MTSLKAFAEWYLSSPGAILLRAPGTNAIRVTKRSSEIIIYRDCPFQVTLVTLFPKYFIPPHYHANVDSYDINITGTGRAVVGGRVWTKKIQSQPRVDLRIPVLSGVVHSGYTEEGSVFLSIQKWKDGVCPGFLADDWVGEGDRK